MPVLMTYIYFYILYFYYIHRRLTIGPVMGYLACNSNYIIDAFCAKYNETWCKGKTAQPLRTKMNFPKGNITRAMQSKPSTAREPGWKMTFIRVGEIAKCFLFPSQILSVLVQAEGRFPLWKAATLPEEADFFFFHRQILWWGQLLVGQGTHQCVTGPAWGLASHSLRTKNTIPKQENAASPEDAARLVIFKSIAEKEVRAAQRQKRSG